MHKQEKLKKQYIIINALLLFVVLLFNSFSLAGYATKSDVKEMSLQEAIALAFRFSPNVKTKYLDRIIQKYSLKNSIHEYELKYNLTGNANNLYSNSSYARTNSDSANISRDRSYSITPGAGWAGSFGTAVTISSSNSFDDNGEYTPGASINITQPLLRGFSKTVNLNSLYSAYEGEEQNKISLRSSIGNVVQEVINTYRDLIRKNNAILSAQRNLDDARKRLETQEAMIAAGRAAKNSILEFQFQCEDAKLGLEGAKKSLDDARIKLLVVIGLESNIAVKVPGNVDVKVMQLPDEEATIKKALARNPEYLMALISLKAAKRALFIAQDGAKWDVSVTANAAVGGVRGVRNMFNGNYHNENVGIAVKVPIDRLPIKTAIVNAKVSLRKSEINLENAKRNLVINVKNQIYNIKNQIDQINAAERALVLARQTYELQVKKQELARATALEVKSASDSLKMTEARIIEAKLGYLAAVDSLNQTTDSFLNEWGIEVKF